MEAARVIAGHFEIVDVAGSGAMGVVHRAIDRRTNKAVAVKLLTRVSGENLARFEREATILSELSHPNIVRYLEHGVAAGAPYLVMEWLEGEDLLQRLKREPLSPAEAVAV